MKARLAASALLAALLLAAGAPISREVREQAYRANNRGVALLEQFSAQEAAPAFREALALDPDLAIARINLAIALFNLPDLPGAEREARLALAASPESPQAHYLMALVARGQDRAEDAKAELRSVLAKDPKDVGANVNLGQLLMQERSYSDAIAAFRAALAAQSFNATAAYNLGIALTRAGQAEEGEKLLERFKALRDSGYGTLIGQSYPEQGRYAEALASTGVEPGLVEQAMPAVRFVDATADVLPSAPPPAGSGRDALFDLDGDGDLDLFDVGPFGQRLYRNDGVRFVDVTRALGLDPSQGGLGAVVGDLDNDTDPDLLVLREDGVTLQRNDAGKAFVDVTAAAGLASAGHALSAALADFDHDGDLDALLGGVGAPDRLFQNAGDATFKDVAAAEGLVAPARVLAAVPTDYDNGRDMDLFEIVEGGPPRLYRNLRDGTFQDVAAEVGLGAAKALRAVAAGDVNKDSFTDFFLGADAGDALALSDGRGRFLVSPAPGASRGSAAAQFLDYDEDGLLDLVTVSARGVRLLRNLGGRFVDASEKAVPELRKKAALSFAAADLDGDGDTDLLLRMASGELRVLRNDGGNRNHAVSVRLAGLVSNRSGVGAKVEMRAGSLTQKLETYATTPSVAPGDVLFGLGQREAADAVRVIWPAGVLQTELAASTPASATSAALFAIKELNRKPSSCPYLYAWNGSSFAFITDFMGGGEMGYWEGPGAWNEPDPVEYVRLTDRQLQAKDGRYEVRVTNELEEALFVDKFALLAFAHPPGVEVYPYEGMTSPAKPVRFFAVRNERSPVSAVDDHGHDVLDRLAGLDRSSPDDFQLRPVRGYADAHTLTLDLGALPERAVLLLTGWTDYAWSSDNVAARQRGWEIKPPSLEVEDASGRWVTAIEQVGVPVGRPQTVLADLAGIWRSPSRRVRIVTNMRIYWDRISVADVADARLDPVALDPTTARLGERGFSAEVTPDGREPYGYEYARVSRVSPWKAFPGRYTREGDVRELVAASDDVFVTSRPGDERALAFDARALPPLPAGWTRTFLLFSDGFSKEMDIHSATPDAIGPLPFHGMSRYPYAAPEAFPMTEARARLYERYNTRVVKAPIAGLDAELHSRARRDVVVSDPRGGSRR